ncbi:MAG: hypothetical protein IKW99_06840 [Bacteroidales bacterium]|nr:hypothetical protein [Bacteroidales bacterium]
MRKIIRLVLTIVVVALLVKLCSNNFGSVISLPGGLGGNDSSGQTDGGWFGQKDKSEKTTTDNRDVPEDIRDLERQLGIGEDDNSSTTTTIPSTTSSTSSNPITFKGIPIKGSASAFGAELVKAGFRKTGDGTYTGDFAGYSGCKLTLVGNNPVQGVRVDFPVIQDWDSLEKSYDSLQASLTQKYGVEPTTSKNNNLAIYNIPGGTISLDADVKDRSSWHVILNYTNSATSILNTTTSGNPIDDL